MDGDHSDEGAHIAEHLCPRLGLSAEDTAAVAWLVKNHLVMSDTAQRRDISDPKTVRDFVAQVQSPEMLRLLLVLTVADIRAVGPGVWNGWKGQLLRELYYEAEAVMTGGDAAPARAARIEGAKTALAARIADLPAEARERALARALRFLLARLRRRRARAPRADEGGGRCGGELMALSAESNDFRAVTEVVIYTPDHSRPVLAARRRDLDVGAARSSTPRRSRPRTASRSTSFRCKDAEGRAVRRCAARRVGCARR